LFDNQIPSDRVVKPWTRLETCARCGLPVQQNFAFTTIVNLELFLAGKKEYVYWHKHCWDLQQAEVAQRCLNRLRAEYNK
jgi:hypothetical protein